MDRLKVIPKKAIVLFSGGVDSTTCLALAIERFGKENVIPLSIIYGQKHEKEVQASADILAYYQMEGKYLNLTDIFRYSNSSLLVQSDKAIPQGSYGEQLRSEGVGIGLVDTYVPFRNGLFLSAAASLALSLDASVIYYGAHQDDVAGDAYPDCSQAFYTAMATAIFEGSGKALMLEAPFVNTNKTGVIKEGLRLGVPYELTWSCYEGKEKPCGHCGTCLDRMAAFKANGIEDPAFIK